MVYKNYPAVEWTVHFKNNGNADTPILENILAMNVSLEIIPEPRQAAVIVYKMLP